MVPVAVLQALEGQSVGPVRGTLRSPAWPEGPKVIPKGRDMQDEWGRSTHGVGCGLCRRPMVKALQKQRDRSRWGGWPGNIFSSCGSVLYLISSLHTAVYNAETYQTVHLKQVNFITLKLRSINRENCLLSLD